MYDIIVICSYGHPYDYEIQTFQPGTSQLEEVEQIKPLPFEDTPFVFVDTEVKLVAMVKDLKGVKMFAADLEVTPCTS